MPLAEIIETTRLILRPHKAEDADDIYAYAVDPEWGRFLPVPEPYLRDHAVEHIENIRSRDREQHPTWAVCVGSQVVGGVNIRFFADHRIAEIGYGLARSHWGQGMTVEAMNVVINAAFDCYRQLMRVRARADAENIGSRRVMEKLGMRLEGELRQDCFMRGQLHDEVVYGLLRCERHTT